MLLRKKAVMALICFVLILGLVYGSTAGNVYGHRDDPCACTLDLVSIEHEDQFYDSGESTYYFDNKATEFLVTSFSALITTGSSTNPYNNHIPRHEVISYYSFDDSNDLGWTIIYDIENFSVSVDDNNDLYFKFVLDTNEPTDSQAAYMHFTRASGVEIISVDPSILPSSGGDVNVTVNGKALPSDLEVRVYDVDGNDLGIVSASDTDVTANSVKAVSDTAGPFTVSLPANTSDVDKTYVIRAAVNGDFFDPSATVTVLAQAEDDEKDDQDDQDENGSSGGKTGDGDAILFAFLGLGSVLILSLVLIVNRMRGKRNLS